ncbi:MAG: hypothetical protein JXB14_00445 [Candidatus Altiarchaeota archaeon]|nr:hypothetical protein [Candidatus Altiarchaeota archaeon]
MDIIGDTSGISGEALKLACAVIIAVSVFSILIGFFLSGMDAKETTLTIGKDLLNETQNASYQILEYGALGK